MRVDATVADKTQTRLILDTGGEITLLSQHLCQQVGCVPDGTYAGKRMSGQEIRVPMARVPSLTIAGHRVSNARVAVLDTTSLLHPELGVEGFAALDLFRDQAFTIDYPAQRVVLENETSLRVRRDAGCAFSGGAADADAVRFTGCSSWAAGRRRESCGVRAPA